MILEKRFAEPDFSAQKLAAAAGLSERYVNELLYEAGASFALRLLELRLRKAADLLAHAGERRISDIAFDCGFNDLSYFNQLPPPLRPDADDGAGAVNAVARAYSKSAYRFLRSEYAQAQQAIL